MKAYTDIEQSKKLAEILPIESADMKWYFWKSEINAPKLPTFGYSKEAAETCKSTEVVYLPCWSLAALLDILHDYTLQTNTNGSIFVVCDSYYPMISDSYRNPVDACYAMILLLKERSLI